MKSTPAFFRSFAILRLLCLFAAFPLLASAADDKSIASVRAADDERVAATVAANRSRLEAILSPELHYVHSSGKVDTKTSYIQSLTTRSTVYESYDYKERTFTPIAPGVVLMSGRVIIHTNNKGQKAELDLNFLAVWREENGHWRFIAWQSSKPTQPAPPAKN
jgi:hypothetical protein